MVTASCQFQRQQETLLNEFATSDALLHRGWLVKRLQNAYPQWQHIIEANNQRPPCGYGKSYTPHPRRLAWLTRRRRHEGISPSIIPTLCVWKRQLRYMLYPVLLRVG
ncbi:hypothetical protein KCP69_05455 [Salmonella enterica subsp. enterica]|nr:hypothetical protein KCP69_05455 [Salmonella enterica subsp. enterica]